MNKTKVILVSIVFLIIGGLYLYVYGDVFKKKVITISHSVRFVRSVRRRNPAATTPAASTPAAPVPTFDLGTAYKLTSVRVIAVDDLITNKYPRPLWELVSDSTSVPVVVFNYGSPLRNMRPPAPGMEPEPLTTNVTYRLYVEAGRVKGQHDFTIKGQEPSQ